MRSVRLDAELDEKIQRAAAVNEESVSDFLRHAAEERADRILAQRGRERFADVAGTIHGGGQRARHTGRAFTEELNRKKRRDTH